MKHKAFLSFGSNIGNSKENILRGYKFLEENDQINILNKSSFYQTKPVGYLKQQDFVNSVLKIETNLSAYDLLQVCQSIEKMLKRERIIRWGPRTIDVDILLFDNMINDDEKLIIPHPRMHERAFVLVPLKEIESNININGKKIDYYLDNIDIEGVKVMLNGN